MATFQSKKEGRRSNPEISKNSAKECPDKRKVLSDIALLTTLDHKYSDGGEKIKKGLLGKEEWCDIPPEFQPWRIDSYIAANNNKDSWYDYGDSCFHYGSHRPWPTHKQDLDLHMRKQDSQATKSSKKMDVFVDKEYRINVPPSGFVTFHILELFNLKIFAEHLYPKVPLSFYCVICIGEMRRVTKIFHSFTSKRIRVDDYAHFSVEVSKWSQSSSNHVRVALWAFQDPEYHFIIGTVDVHLFDCIRKRHCIETQKIWGAGIYVGEMVYEYAFSYGSFGYGYSNQLLNPFCSIDEMISLSSFPRIKPKKSEVRQHPHYIRIPKDLKVFSYNSYILELEDKKQGNKNAQTMSSGDGETKKQKLDTRSAQPKNITVNQVEFVDGFAVHCKVHMNIWQKEFQADLCHQYGRFLCIRRRKDRLDHLNVLLHGKMPEIEETDATTGSLFTQLKPSDSEKLQSREVLSGLLIHPFKIPCKETKPVRKLSKQENRFMDNFPSTRRFSGYLDVMFGYEPKPGKTNHKENDAKKGKHVWSKQQPPAVTQTTVESSKTGAGDIKLDFDYPLFLKTKRRWKPKRCQWCTCWNCVFCFRALIRSVFLFFQTLFKFLCPDFRAVKPIQLPEISVTRPSPEGSTTDVYAYFAQEDAGDHTMTQVESLIQQTSKVIENSRKKAKEFHRHRHDSYSSSD